MAMWKLFRRRSPAVPAPPPPPDPEMPEKARGWPWRWIVILVAVTVVGLARAQFPTLLTDLRTTGTAFWQGISANRPPAEPVPEQENTIQPLGEEWQATQEASVPVQPTVTRVPTVPAVAGESLPEPPAEMDIAPAAEAENDVPVWSMGLQVYGSPALAHVTVWIAPGSPTGHIVVERYPPGTSFVIIEPDQQHRAYPVVMDDIQWWRIQASDGLVGWVRQAELTTEKPAAAP